MTNDEIIDMAEKVTADFEGRNFYRYADEKWAIDFARLVAKRKREEIELEMKGEKDVAQNIGMADIVERLRFQTRYAKGLVPVTMFEAADEIKKLRHEIAVMTHGIEVEIERLRQVCRDAYEVYAGSEGIPLPETAAEAYLYQLLMTMKDEIRRGLK
jgi:hypothetical protein